MTYPFESEDGRITNSSSRKNFLNYSVPSSGRTSWRVWAILPESRNSIQSRLGAFFFYMEGEEPPPLPRLLDPPHRQRKNGRHVIFIWTPVPGAVSYIVSFVYQNGIELEEPAAINQLEMTMPGDGEFTWRVSPIFASRRLGPSSKPRTLICL